MGSEHALSNALQCITRMGQCNAFASALPTHAAFNTSHVCYNSGFVPCKTAPSITHIGPSPLQCRCSTTDLRPAVDITEADDPGRSRLECPGCSLDASWQEVPDDDGAPAMFFICRVGLCGEAGPVALVVPPCALADSQGAAVGEVRQAMTILPGVASSRQPCWAGYGASGGTGCGPGREVAAC